jgi:hypothetical protein
MEQHLMSGSRLHGGFRCEMAAWKAPKSMHTAGKVSKMTAHYGPEFCFANYLVYKGPICLFVKPKEWPPFLTDFFLFPDGLSKIV